MSNPYDKLARVIDGQHDPILYDPNEPYRGIAWLWNGDAFGPRREDLGTSERADWFAIPGHPTTLLYAGHIAIAGWNAPVHLDDYSREEDVATAQAYLANPAVAEHTLSCATYSTRRQITNQLDERFPCDKQCIRDRWCNSLHPLLS